MFEAWMADPEGAPNPTSSAIDLMINDDAVMINEIMYGIRHGVKKEGIRSETVKVEAECRKHWLSTYLLRLYRCTITAR